MRFTLRQIIIILFALFFITAVVGGLWWANLNFSRSMPGGKDFFVLWQGTRNFSMQGSLPYNDVTPQVEDFVYGAGRSGETLPRFTLPLYLVFIYIPFAMLSEPVLARSIWLLFLELELLGLVLLVFQLIDWKPAWPYRVVLFLFGVFWAPAIAALLSGSPIIFQAVLLLFAIRAMQFQADEAAGALLALAWFNLEAVGLSIFLILFWAASVGRWRPWGGFLMATLILVGLSILFNASWPLPFLGAILANWQGGVYPSTYSLFEGWLPGIGLRLAQGLTILTALILIMEWRAVRGKELRWLFWTFSLTAAATPLLGMPFSPVWAVLALPALLVVLSIMDQRWGAFGRWGAILLFLVVFFGLWRGLLLGDQGAAVIVFFPMLLIFLLYWVRWWAIRTPRLWVDVISELGT